MRRLHDSAISHYKPSNPQELAGWLHAELGIRWFKLLINEGSAYKLDFIDALVGAGIMPIVRLYTDPIHPGKRLDPATIEAIREYVRHGVPYFEYGNEPNHSYAWQFEYDWERNPELVALQFVENAQTINNLGGIHLVPAVDTGGNWKQGAGGSRLWWKRFLAGLEHVSGGFETLERNAIAAHMRPDVHPPEYPYIWANQNDPDQLARFGHYPTIHDDWTALRMDEMIDDLVFAELGHSVPILGTEAGYGGGAPLCGDSRFPCIDVRLQPPTYGFSVADWSLGLLRKPISHAEANIEMFRRYSRPYKPPLLMPDGKWLMSLSNGYRDARFCDCFWEMGGAEWYEHDTWPDDHLLHNHAWGGGPLPLVEAMKREPKFVRKFSWEGEPTMPEYQFVLGFKVLADQLGAAVVGKPLMAETYLGETFVYQVTSKGMMVAHKNPDGTWPMAFLPKA